MPRYAQVVLETRIYKVRYIVEADNAAEAAELIATGETEEEVQIGDCQEVLKRDDYSNLKELKD